MEKTIERIIELLIEDKFGARLKMSEEIELMSKVSHLLEE